MSLREHFPGLLEAMSEETMSDESWLQQMNDEQREKLLEEALQECHDKGISKEAMLTLLFETGSRWMPHAEERRAA